MPLVHEARLVMNVEQCRIVFGMFYVCLLHMLLVCFHCASSSPFETLTMRDHHC